MPAALLSLDLSSLLTGGGTSVGVTGLNVNLLNGKPLLSGNLLGIFGRRLLATRQLLANNWQPRSAFQLLQASRNPRTSAVSPICQSAEPRSRCTKAIIPNCLLELPDCIRILALQIQQRCKPDGGIAICKQGCV